jgi:hypothetical protein
VSAVNLQFAIVPIEALSDALLTPSEFKVLVALYSFRDQNADTVWPKIDTLAERAGFKQKTQVSKITTRLESKGWLSKAKKKSFHGPKIYRLTIPERLLQSGEISQVGKTCQVGKSEEGESFQVGKNYQVGKTAPTKLAETTNCQVGRNYQHDPEHTSLDHTNYQTSSEPDGSAASAVKPVDNSRLARFGNFYDLPDQDLDSPQENLFTVGVRVLGKYGIESPRARSMLAKLKADHGQGPTLDALTELVCREPSSNPIGWLQTLLKSERREMPADWKPSPGVVSTLQGLGIPMPVIDNARAFFKLWVLDRAIASNDFDGWFVEWCIRDFEDAECDVNRQAGWYGNAKAQEFHEPAGGCLA